MDIIKVQTNILKNLIKGKLNKCFFSYVDDYIWISTDGFVSYRIFKDSFFIDFKGKFLEGDILKEHVDQALKENLPADTVTKASFKNPDDIKDIIILTRNFGEIKVYVDYKLIKPFESKKSRLTFSISTAVSPVLIYEDGVLVGTVMPFRCANPDNITDERSYYDE